MFGVLDELAEQFADYSLGGFASLDVLGVQINPLKEEPLQFTVAGLPAAATLAAGAVYGTAVLTWVPTVADLGAYTVTFGVADGGNGSPAAVLTDGETVTFTVRTGNAVPELASLADQIVAEFLGRHARMRQAIQRADDLGRVLVVAHEAFGRDRCPVIATHQGVELLEESQKWVDAAHRARTIFVVLAEVARDTISSKRPKSGSW